jgi:hypothetical protein
MVPAFKETLHQRMLKSNSEILILQKWLRVPLEFMRLKCVPSRTAAIARRCTREAISKTHASRHLPHRKYVTHPWQVYFPNTCVKQSDYEAHTGVHTRPSRSGNL